MKFIGGSLLWTALILIGMTNASRLNLRVTLNEKTKLLIDGIKLEFEYANSSVPEIIDKFSSQENFQNVKFIKQCQQQIRNGIDFPIAWQSSIVNSECLYNKDEKEKLLQLGNSLGTSDLNGQIMILNLYSKYFAEFLEVAKMNRAKYANLSISLGVFSGFALFVLVL